MERALTVPSVESKGSQHVVLERKQEALILLSDGVFLKQRLLNSSMNPLTS